MIENSRFTTCNLCIWTIFSTTQRHVFFYRVHECVCVCMCVPVDSDGRIKISMPLLKMYSFAWNWKCHKFWFHLVMCMMNILNARNICNIWIYPSDNTHTHINTQNKPKPKMIWMHSQNELISINSWYSEIRIHCSCILECHAKMFVCFQLVESCFVNVCLCVVCVCACNGMSQCYDCSFVNHGNLIRCETNAWWRFNQN